MATEGISNLHYAVMTTEDTATTAPVYGTPKRLVGINKVNVDYDNETKTLLGDNQSLATKTKTKKATITLEIARLPLEDRAALLGHSYNSSIKVMEVAKDDKPPYVALMYKVQTDEDKEELNLFYKGKFAPSNEDTETDGKGSDFGLHNLTGEFVYRLDNGKLKGVRLVEPSDTTTIDAFFSSVGGGLS